MADSTQRLVNIIDEIEREKDNMVMMRWLWEADYGVTK